MVQEPLESVEAFRTKGNEHFQKAETALAIEAYSNAINVWNDSFDINVKAVLLSNRAACYLKHPQTIQLCIDDCTEALDILDHDDAIRCKIYYRRAKAQFLLSEQNNANTGSLLNDAAKDLLTLFSIDGGNKDAAALLRAVRAKHGLTKGTPISQTLVELEKATDDQDRVHQLNVLLGLLTNDASTSLELGRRGGTLLLLRIASVKSIQVLSCACSNPKFVREYGKDIDQARLVAIIQKGDEDLALAALSVLLRLVLYLDDLESLDDQSLVGEMIVVQACLGISLTSNKLLPATLNVLGSWTAVDRENLVQASTEVSLVAKKTEAELRSIKPREVAAYKKKLFERLQRDRKWAKERSLGFLNNGGLEGLLSAAVHCEDHSMRKQVGIMLGRIMASIQDNEDIEKVAKGYLGSNSLVIEELSDEKTEQETSQESLIISMKRAQLTSSLLLGTPEVGTWALEQTKDELRNLITSGDAKAMGVASEVVSAAASIEKSRSAIAVLMNNGVLDYLLEDPNQDIRSGAASALAKLGLADKVLSANEGEVMGLLQIAVELLDQEHESVRGNLIARDATKFVGNSSATTAVERGVEIIGYLASKTQVKDELAHGFKYSPLAASTALEHLVELANREGAGESVSAYALATVFGMICVSSETLRREAFAGKEMTMEQYDELQKLGKTEEEKELIIKEADDTQEAVEERTRILAHANVPRALVKLMNGASESTLKQIVTALNRMAGEVSVRGLLIQQGALSACIKIERGAHASETEINSARQARHCVAKILVTTNPGLLTTSQRMGSIKPLIDLIKDNDSSSLQQFEALMAITNLASTSDETKDRIVAEKGISTLSYAMFSDHEMVRRAGTEALCNLVPHPAMMKYLANPENLRLWMAYAADYEGNFDCARAASGCLAMSTQDSAVAATLVGLNSFREATTTLLESGDLELMHRILVMIENLVEQGGETKEAVISAGLVAFCTAYADSYHGVGDAASLGFDSSLQGQLAVTVELAKRIASFSE